MNRWQKIDKCILCFLAGAIVVLAVEFAFYIGRTTAPLQAFIGQLTEL